VIDNSSRWRMRDDVPLVVSEVNPQALGRAPPASSPNPTARPCRWCGLKPLHDEAGIERLVITPTRPCPAAGEVRSRSCSTSRTPCSTRGDRRAEQYAHQIAFNALPHAGNFAAGDDHTDEERKADQRDTQDPRRPVDSHQRHVRARAGGHWTFGGASTADPGCALARAPHASCWPHRPG